MSKLICSIYGFISGIINGLLGAGGGMVLVPILKKHIDIKKAHATSVCIIFPICVTSSISYILNGKVTINDTLPYLFWGVIGAIIGTIFLQKINGNLLKKIFSLLMIWAGIRLLFK